MIWSSLGLAMALGFGQESTLCYGGRSLPHIDALGLFPENMSGKGWHREAIQRGIGAQAYPE